MAHSQGVRLRRKKSTPTVSDPICHKCNKAITKRIVTALGKTWHPEHFACKDCNQLIPQVTCKEKDGQPVCKECFLKNYTDKCHGCKEPIVGLKIEFFGQTWHEKCFVCAGPCKKSLLGISFLERDGQGYCYDDFMELFAERCARCAKPVAADAVAAFDGKWHQQCFRCSQCSKRIAISTYEIEDGKPICIKCVWKKNRENLNQ